MFLIPNNAWLWLLVVSLARASTTFEVSEEAPGLLPHDIHISAANLPLFSTNQISCTCDRPTTSCRASAPCPGEARILYLVGIHNNRTLNDAVHLFRGIRDPRNTILIHIDVKFDMRYYEQSTLRLEIEACPCGSHVEVASVHNATWSSWSMNLPTLWAMEKGVKEYDGRWDVFINLSGDTLPVYTPDRISKLFGGPLAGTNFITSSACETGLQATPITAFPKGWHKRKHYSHHPASLDYVDADGTSHSNVTLITHFGSQWVALLPEWCHFLVDELERPDSLSSQFRNYLIKSRKLMTDETFMPTLIMHLFPDTTPRLKEDKSLDTDLVSMYAIRFERMDEHVPSASGWFPTEQRYEVPKSSGVEVPHAWGPYYLGVYDLLNIKESGALFIRKVATSIDHNIFQMLPVGNPADIPPITWPKEVLLSPVPNWEKKLADLRKKYEQERAAKMIHESEKKDEPENNQETSSREVDEEGGDSSSDDTGSWLPTTEAPNGDLNQL